MAKHKILVIAEIQGAGAMLLMILRKEGYDVVVIDPFGFRSLPKGYAGVDEAMSENKFDLIIPTSYGFAPPKILELIPEIKKREPTAKMSVEFRAKVLSLTLTCFSGQVRGRNSNTSMRL